MKNEHTSQIMLVRAKNSSKKPIPQLVSSVITYFALAVIVLLAIPACLLLGVIGGVWSVTDKIVQAIAPAAE